ncbi:TonB-dependent receptor [Candidatus Fermentibacterales bacterium]|nr:TonB-dependent receptor [Candidatus Fermentibacterales bacterium]
MAVTRAPSTLLLRLAFVAIPLVLAAVSEAGTTGALAGRVSGEDGEPLPGATIVIEGTPLGAFTDQNGEFFVYAVPPGTYSVSARMVGMTTVTKQGIRILTDQTTVESFELAVSPAGHTVIQVTDRRNLILENVPSTIHVLDLTELRLMPVPDILDVLGRQPGIVTRQGAMHVRGGRPGEVAFLLDGIPSRSPLDYSYASTVPLSALSQTSLTTGGIDAEYGNAMSGVVSMVTREGGRELEGELYVRGGDMTEFGYENIARNYSEPSENDSYRSNAIDVECALGGPEPITGLLLPALGAELPGEVTVFGSLRYMRSGRDLRDSRDNWENNWQNFFSGSLKITSRPSASTRLSLLGFYNYRQSGWDEWAWSRYDEPAYIEGEPYLGGDPDYALPIRFLETGGATGSLTRMLGDDVCLDFRLNQTRFCHWRRILDPDGGYFGEAYSPGDWATVFYPTPRVADSLGFYHSGVHPDVWLESRTTVSTGKTDITVRASQDLEIKGGLESRYYDVYDYSVYLESQGDCHVSLWRAYPSSHAAYVRSTWKLGSGMVLNAGIRFDLFLPNADSYDPDGGGWSTAEAKHQISPRFGVTHPVTERDVFFATYGHYFQMPNLNQLYFGTDYNISGLYSLVGNPDLEAERTVAYEAGVRHRISETTSIALSAFYKDITGLVRTGEHYSEGFEYYYVYENDNSHATVRGFELKLLGLPEGPLSGSASYCYTIARGRYSSPLEAWQYGAGGYLIEPTTDNYLDWDQRHAATVHATLSIPRGEGPSVLGCRPLEGTEVTLDWAYGSGFPFSPPPGESLVPDINTMRYPSTTQTDLGVARSFWIGPLTLRTGVTVYNLLDARNLDRIFDAGYYLEQGDPGGPAGNPGAWSPARHLALRLTALW